MSINSSKYLQTLQPAQWLDASADASFDRLARLAVQVLDTPIVLISLLDENRLIFLSRYNLPEPWAARREIPLSHSFCQYALTTGQPLIVEDTRNDPRLGDHPGLRDLGVLACAGVPLLRRDKTAFGTLCVLDHHARQWSARELALLHDFAAVVTSEIELHQRLAGHHQVAIQQHKSGPRLPDFTSAAYERFFQAIEALDEAFALYDASDRLLICNSRYREGQGAAAGIVEPGMRFQDLLRVQLRRGAIEEAKGREQRWFRQRLRRFRCPTGPFDQQSPTGHWVQFSERRLADGGLLLTALDISERKRAESALYERETQLRLITDAMPAVITYVDTEQRYRFANAACEQRLGIAGESILGKHLRDVLGVRNYGLLQQHIESALSGRPVQFDFDMPDSDGNLRNLQVNYVPDRDGSGGVAGFYVLGIDLTERKRLEAELFHEKELAQVTLASIGDAVITTDADGRVRYFNSVAERLTGWSYTEAQGRPLDEVFHIINEDTREQVPNPVAFCLAENRTVGLASDTILISRDYSEYAIQDSAAPIRNRDGTLLGVVLVFSDVSEQRRLAHEMLHQAAHDTLTGLVNRREFERRLKRVLDTAAVEGGEHALCYLDLDQFKIVNDTCGHAAGDELLRQLAGLLQTKIRRRDTLARLGGDEFAVLLEHCPLQQAEQVANNMRRTINGFRFAWNDKRFRVGVSIGLVPIDGINISLEAILQAADRACYVAKDSGRNRVHIYHEHDIELTRHNGQILWATRIQQALDENRFQLYAQQIAAITPADDEGLHCELLLRLRDEQDRIVSPGAFIPAAERYHLVVPIDRWVIRTAFNRLTEHPAFLERLALCAINLSGRSLGDKAFQAFVLRQFEQTAMPAEKICFEITETAAISNLDHTTQFIKMLKAKGCRFALDDFGSGLSSFAYLRNLPVDFLKIDGVFVKDIVEDPIQLAMVRSINEIGQLMGKKTIAEYVENQAILDQLRLLGVHYAQGFGIAMPCPLADLLTETNP